MAIQGIKDFIANHWVAGVGAATLVGVASKVTSEVCKYLRPASSSSWWNWSGAELSGPCEHAWTLMQEHPIVVIGSGVALVGAAFMVKQLADQPEAERPVTIAEPNPQNPIPIPPPAPHPIPAPPAAPNPITSGMLSLGRDQLFANCLITRNIRDGRPISLTVRVLNLSSTGIKDAGVADLAGALEGNTVLRELDLSNNEITHRGVRALALALHENRALQVLRLSNSSMNRYHYYAPIMSIDYEALAEMLEKNTVLRELDLTGHNVDEDAAKDFAQALKVNTALQELNIDSSHRLLPGTRDLISWHLVNNRNLASNQRSLTQMCCARAQDMCGVVRPQRQRPEPYRPAPIMQD